MPSRRGFLGNGVLGCALCAAGLATGFAATPAGAEAPAAAGIKRNILRRSAGPTPDYETVLAEAYIDANFQVPRHIHPGVESGYIVEGKGMLEIDGLEPMAVKPGDGVVIEARRPHLLKNGDKPMKIVSTYIIEKGQPLAIPV